MVVEEILEYWHVTRKLSEGFKGHCHDSANYEINIVLSGELEVTCGSRVFSLKSGDMVFFSANKFFHRNIAVSKTDTDFVLIIFNLKECDLPDNFLQFYRLSQYNLDIIKIIDDELVKNSFGQTPAGKALLQAFLLRLEKDAHNINALSSGSALIYHNAVKFIKKDLSKNLSVKEIAQECGVCITVLKNIFAKYTGKGVAEYCFEIKMDMARELLLSGVPSKEVAISLGFSSPSYFSQCFRRKNGCSVREYIKNVQ